MARPINILVGCGGSGSKTLQRVNKLLSEDPKLRSRIDNDFYYIIVDTEVAEVEEFEAKVREQMRGAAMPVIKGITLSQGKSILQGVVGRHFVDQFADRDDADALKGKERLAEHWWMKNNQPFVAPDVRPLTKGAGQCPPASYFLAWSYLETMNKEFDDLVHQIIARTADSGVPLSETEINFFIVSGLSGGTGRGCWELIAFKLRQLFEQYGCRLSPIAYLFDSSCYMNVIKQKPDQELSMRVNSLTGVSELTCWMRNIHGTDESGAGSFAYRLPSLEAPADEDMDVLVTKLDLDVRSGAPVHMAYLIFGSSGIAALDKNKDFHDMVGTAIYASLTQSAIDSQAINSNFPYLGLAAASFEIDAQTLRKYFECRLRCNAVDTLCCDAKEDTEESVQEFFKQTGLFLDVTARDRSKLKPDGKGTFLQQFGARLLAACETEIGSLEEELTADNDKEVASAVEELMNGSDSAVDTAFEAASQDMDVDPRHVVFDLVEKLYKKTKSVKAICDFVDMVCGSMAQVVKDLPAADKLRLDESQDPKKLVKKYKGKEYKVAGRKFNEQEIADIMDSIRLAVVHANYAAIITKIEGFYGGLCKEFLTYRHNGEFVTKQLDAVKSKFLGQLKDLCGAQNDPYEFLFTKASAPEKGIAAKFDTSKFFRRILRPVMDEKREKELLGTVDFGADLKDLIRNALKQDGLNVEDQDSQNKLRRGLESSIRSGVAVGETFMKENFAIKNVISELRKVWQAKLTSVRGDSDMAADIEEQFTSFFGVTPDHDGDEIVLKEDEEFAMQMGISLARNCHPFWRLRQNMAAQEQTVTIFLPLTEGKGTLTHERAQDMVVNALPRSVTVNVRFASADSNDFVLLTYATGGVDTVEDIASLDYWKSDARVMKWLRRCEDPAGGSLFDSSENNKGRGYPEPLVVKNEQLAGMRWRPWMEGKKKDETPDINMTLDALVYAMLVPEGSIKEKLDKMGWALPLIKDAGSQRFTFTRPAYRYEDGNVSQDRSKWKADQLICQSICQVYDGLLGNSKKDGKLKENGSAWRDRIIEESEIFWGAVATKCGFSKGSDAYKELLDAHEGTLGDLKDAADNDDLDTFEKLVQRVITLRS